MRSLFLLLIIFTFISSDAALASDTACMSFLKKNNVKVNTEVTVNHRSSDVEFNFNKNRRELSQLSGKFNTYGNQVINGLTVANFRHSLASNFIIVDMSSGYSCVWPDQVNIDIGYTDMNVYVASDFKRNSCAQITTLKHELEHVKVHQSTLTDGVSRISKNIKYFAHDKFPILLPTNREPDKIALSLLTKELNRNVSIYETERDMLNNKLDTPSSYKYWQSLCSDW